LYEIIMMTVFGSACLIVFITGSHIFLQ
jgi:hypothetical protein